MHTECTHSLGMEQFIPCVAMPYCSSSCLPGDWFSKLLKSEILWIAWGFIMKSLQKEHLRNSMAQKVMAQRCPQRDWGTAEEEWNAEEHSLDGLCSAGRAARRLWFLHLLGGKSREVAQEAAHLRLVHPLAKQQCLPWHVRLLLLAALHHLRKADRAKVSCSWRARGRLTHCLAKAAACRYMHSKHPATFHVQLEPKQAANRPPDPAWAPSCSTHPWALQEAHLYDNTHLHVSPGLAVPNLSIRLKVLQ